MRGNGEQTGDGWHEATCSPALSNRYAVTFRAVSRRLRHNGLTRLSDLAQVARHTLVVLLALGNQLGAAEAQAAQAPPKPHTEPFRVFWSSSADCGSAESFASELKARDQSLRDAERDERATTFLVETFREDAGVRGQLIVRRPDGQVSTRQVPGATCAEVESALALIASLMMDPLSMGMGPGKQTPSADIAPVEPKTGATERDPRPHLSLRAEHRLIGQGAVAPGLSWGQAARLMLTHESRAWSPSVGLSLHVTGATASGSHGSAELEWLAGQLSACPLAGEAAPRWDLRGCALLQVGRLRGTGYQTTSPAARSILWTGAGLQVEGRFELLGPLWLGWEAAVVFPFTRERFYLAAPEETLHRIPAAGGSFGLGAGLRFF